MSNQKNLLSLFCDNYIIIKNVCKLVYIIIVFILAKNCFYLLEYNKSHIWTHKKTINGLPLIVFSSIFIYLSGITSTPISETSTSAAKRASKQS